MGFNPFSGRSLIGLGTLGLSELLGEDTMSKVPVLGSLAGAQSDETKRLLETQQRLAEETRRQQEKNQQMRMNALGQQMLAFNPRNQAMAQMFGPEAAFNPQQMQAMMQDPRAQQQWGTGSEQERRDQVLRKQEEQRRAAMLQQNMQPLGPGPAPINMPAPQPGRRY
jgi:hypothetical protein